MCQAVKAVNAKLRDMVETRVPYVATPPAPLPAQPHVQMPALPPVLGALHPALCLPHCCLCTAPPAQWLHKGCWLPHTAAKPPSLTPACSLCVRTDRPLCVSASRASCYRRASASASACNGTPFPRLRTFMGSSSHSLRMGTCSSCLPC